MHFYWSLYWVLQSLDFDRIYGWPAFGTSDFIVCNLGMLILRYSRSSGYIRSRFLMKKNATLAAIASTPPSIPTPTPIFAPVLATARLDASLGIEELVPDGAELPYPTLEAEAEVVVEMVEEARFVDVEVNSEFEFVEETPIVAAMETPCFG